MWNIAPVIVSLVCTPICIWIGILQFAVKITVSYHASVPLGILLSVVQTQNTICFKHHSLINFAALDLSN